MKIYKENLLINKNTYQKPDVFILVYNLKDNKLEFIANGKESISYSEYKKNKETKK